jgi:hypothetical protein
VIQHFPPNLSWTLEEVELLVDLRTLREADKALESALPLSCKVQLKSFPGRKHTAIETNN